MTIWMLAALAAALIALSVRLYIRRWSRGLSLTLRFVPESLTEGETGAIEQIFTNRKLLPFWWGDIRYTVPAFLTVNDPGHTGREYYSSPVSAFSYEQVRRTIPFAAGRRGYGRIGGAEIATQDFFFRYRMLARAEASAEIYVFPAWRNPGKFEPRLRRITGEILRRRLLLEDPFQLRGIRDYTPADSLRKVNWKATARSGGLKVNEFSSTISGDALLLLDFDPGTSWNPDALREELIRVAAGLAARLTADGVPYGLMSNACDTVTGREARLPCRGGTEQRTALNRCLARLDTSRLSRPFSDLLDTLPPAGRRPQLVLLSTRCDGALAGRVARMRPDGPGLQWILIRAPGAKSDDSARGAVIWEAAV